MLCTHHTHVGIMVMVDIMDVDITAADIMEVSKLLHVVLEQYRHSITFLISSHGF